VDSGWVSVTGLIVRDPDPRDYFVNLRIQVESFNRPDSTTSTPSEGVILAQVPRYGSYAYGDRVIVSGNLITPPEYDEFSYRDYLARRGIQAIMPDAQIETIDHHQGTPWNTLMYDLKGRAQRTLDRLLPSPQAPLLSGILLGNDSSLPQNVRDSFNETSTSHIIAISGSNIVIVIAVLMRMFTAPFGERRARWFTLGGIAFYTTFVGADPAVVRAALMGGLSIFAMQSNRRAHGLTSLAFAIWLMTIWNPSMLWEIGFQLSVAATIGLIVFGKLFSNKFEAALRRGFKDTTARQIAQWLGEPLVITLAA